MGKAMNDQCKFIDSKGHRCGSYAFNLYKEQIDQGDRCDHHYWKDRAVKAEALVDAARADEREECAKVCDVIYCDYCADAIRAGRQA
jgi:hypothetical protein